MILKEFIEKFILPNTLCRLLYKEKNGFIEVEPDVHYMEHELINCKYSDREVIGIKDIYFYKSHYMEVVNIVIER